MDRLASKPEKPLAIELKTSSLFLETSFGLSAKGKTSGKEVTICLSNKKFSIKPFKRQNEAIKLNKKRIAKDRMEKAISTALCHMDCLDVEKWDELAEKAIYHYNMI